MEKPNFDNSEITPNTEGAISISDYALGFDGAQKGALPIGPDGKVDIEAQRAKVMKELLQGRKTESGGSVADPAANYERNLTMQERQDRLRAGKIAYDAANKDRILKEQQERTA